MSKYAVIKVGSSQERVSVGDEFSVSSSFEEKTVVPVLVSPRKGQIVVDDKELKNYKVELEHLSSSKSKKINIFQYKNKTGNRRRVGYRDISLLFNTRKRNVWGYKKYYGSSIYNQIWEWKTKAQCPSESEMDYL